ncbi:MAG TPA: cytochrome c family protein [Rhizomicrobium sp.]|jgi:cytochrome c|nr:cytochrome c family protein [Rhizomicrobium sp.]
MMRYAAFAVTTLLACGTFSISASAQEGDAAQGKTVFARCAICHKVDKNAGNGLGPNLFGIVGRKAASLPGFEYSGPMKASGLTWTPDNLAKWVAGPAKMLPGTKMAFPGITSKGEVRDVVAYLGTLK